MGDRARAARVMALTVLVAWAGCRRAPLAPAQPDLARSAARDLGVAPGGDGADAFVVDLAAAPDVAPSYAAPHPPLPQLPDNRGGKLSPLSIVFILASGDTQAAALEPVPRDLLASDWFRRVSDGYGISAGSTSVLYGAALPSGTNLTHDQLLAYIATTLTSNGAPAHPGNTIFVFFFPDGTQWVDGNGKATGPAAWHAAYDADGDAYGAVQRRGGLTLLTELASHEILEAATDTPNSDGYRWPDVKGNQPWQQSVWLYSEGSELGDMCERLHWVNDGQKYPYARIWNNAAAAADRDPCVQPRAGAYYNVGAWEQWVPVAAGQTATIVLHGWSTAPVGDWTLTPQVKSANASDFSASIASATHVDGGSAPTINNGGSATLTVSVAATAASGEWAVVRVGSDATAAFAGADGLAWAVWPVGFYVP